MKRNTKIIFAVVTAITVVSGTVAIAGGGHGRIGERMVSKLTKKLDLTEQQATALDSLKLEIQETRNLMRGNLDSQSQTIKELVSAETFDQGAALEMITARTTALQTQAPELVAAAAAFFDVLDNEQKQELSDMMNRFSERRGGRHDRGN